MRVVVIVCTYNEAESTPGLIAALDKVFATIKNHEMAALYVDDSSPDGTAKIVEGQQKKYKWLHLLVNPTKGGLGAAYAVGMKHAMSELKADYLLEFDADFQHPPEYIPRLVEQIDKGYDYVIGSRYVPGGSIPKSWGMARSLLSVVGNLVARILLILPTIHDVTTGFKLSRVKGFMNEFDFNTLISKQFAYKIQLLFYMVNKGAKVVEVPFAFAPRTSGESKIIKNEMKETLRLIFLLQLRNPKILKLIKFGTVGFLGYLVNAISLYIFTKLNFPSWAAWGVSTELAIMNNFALNNIWTFKEQQIKGLTGLGAKFLQFNLTSSGGLLIQVAVGWITDRLLGPSYRQLVLPVTIAFLVMPYNYLMYNLVIWRKKAPSSK